MTNPTSNYNFQMPTATDLVTDLPADFEVFGQAVDTRLKALQPGTTLGDLAYSSATANTNTRLPIGTSGQVLAVSGGGVPEWTTTADVTPLTTKGDLFTFTTVDARIGVGANGTVLTADSSEATGLKWVAPAGGGKIGQVVSATQSTLASINSATYVDINLSATITPSSVSSRILVFFSVPTRSISSRYGKIRLMRDATSILELAGTGSDAFPYVNADANLAGGSHYLDNPTTTSAITYKIQAITSNTIGYNYATSIITLMEVLP